MNNPFLNKVLLVTGGTGLFGNAVVNRFLNTDVKEIRIFSRDVKRQDKMRLQFKSPKIKYYTGDTRDKSSVDYAMEGVDYLFHAAGLNQVQTCEFFPIEAVKTNVLGCENVIDSALQNGVKNIGVLSTDEAVNPVNVLGMSAAICEKVMIAKSRKITKSGVILYCARCSNIMASEDSVIQLFVEQIKTGKPIQITNPDITRFIATAENDVDLVLFAFRYGKPGDIFVRKAPATTIETIANALKELYNAGNPIKIIDIRHNEKLYESLVNNEEMAKVIDLGDYYRIPASDQDLNYDKNFSGEEEDIKKAESYTSSNTTRLDIQETKELLMKLDFIRKDLEAVTTT